MIKAVIFDFDHTLYDRERTIAATAPLLRRLLAEYVHPHVTDEQFFDALFAAEISENGYYTNGYQGVCDELDRLGVFAVKPTKAQYCEAFYPTMSANIVMFEDAYYLLGQLKSMGYKVALLTNGFVKSQREKLSHTRIPEYMDEIIISEELNIQKPDPGAFLAMCRRLGVRADEAVYVGDNIINDVCGARDAGLLPIWKPFAREWPEHLDPPAYTIRNLTEVIDILKDIDSAPQNP
ncbi:MAG: HAD family hydrolase [Clostridia bacterium]|nr:HAD family hydrolase [Clostridia bacterium]